MARPKVNHGECAIVMPDPYAGTVETANEPGKKWSVIQAATFFNTAPLLDRVGDWAICTDGLYCLTTLYEITAGGLSDPDLREHMSEKTWVKSSGFSDALGRAISLGDAGYIRD
jgi:hypothetical protein